LETRLIFAYGLIAAVVIFTAVAFAVARYNAHDRKIERVRKREYVMYCRRQEEDGFSDLGRPRRTSTSEQGDPN
jgi:hypothetical protein